MYLYATKNTLQTVAMKGFNGSAVILNWTRKGLHRGSTHNSEVFENSGSAA